MKRLAFFLSSILIAVTVLTDHSRADQIVTLSGDPFPPYIEGQLGSEATGGIGYELIKELFSRIDGVDVRFPLVPWERALREVKEGSMDGIAILLKTPEREEYMVYTDVFFSSSALVWYSAKKFPSGFTWNSLKDFEGYRIGTTRGYSYGDEIDQALANSQLQVIEVTSEKQAFAMLEKGRVDLVLANDAVGYALANSSSSPNEIHSSEKATGKDIYYIAISKKSPARHLIPQMNSAIASMKADGSFERMGFGGKR